jgi:hypothetical protein
MFICLSTLSRAILPFSPQFSAIRSKRDSMVLAQKFTKWKNKRMTKIYLLNLSHKPLSRPFIVSWVVLILPILSQYSTSQQSTWDQLVQVVATP